MNESPKILAKSNAPLGEAKIKLVAYFVGLGWWDQMSINEREAFFERGEVLDSDFARSILLPLIHRSNLRP